MTDEELSEIMLKIFMPDEFTAEFFGRNFTMHVVPIAIDKQIQVLRSKVKETDETEENLVSFYLISCDILLEYYNLKIKIDDFLFEEVKKFVDMQLNIQKSESIMVEELKRRYKIPVKKGEKKEREIGLPEFVGWFSFAIELKQPVSSILKTYTHGQLDLMALASQILYMTPEQKKVFGDSYDVPKPNFKTAKLDEILEYYRAAGFE